MQPVRFEGHNTVFAEDQPEYIPLPAYRGEDGQVISCWQLSWKERLRIVLTGKVWLRTLTYNQPLQPQALETAYPFERG